MPIVLINLLQPLPLPPMHDHLKVFAAHEREVPMMTGTRRVYVVYRRGGASGDETNVKKPKGNAELPGVAPAPVEGSTPGRLVVTIPLEMKNNHRRARTNGDIFIKRWDLPETLKVTLYPIRPVRWIRLSRVDWLTRNTGRICGCKAVGATSTSHKSTTTSCWQSRFNSNSTNMTKWIVIGNLLLGFSVRSGSRTKKWCATGDAVTMPNESGSLTNLTEFLMYKSPG